jgi:hypothetical protein
VTDQASVSITFPASSEGGPEEGVKHRPPPPCRSEPQPSFWLRCRICGRAGRFLQPFPRIPRRR